MAERILIVEDNEFNLMMLRDVLRAHGYEVIEARNGEEGIRTAKEHRPDLILMDMQMPVMDGFKAIEILKADPLTQGIKIIVITSYAMKGDRERIMALGVEDYIPKPVDTRELPAVIERVLKGQGRGLVGR